MLHSVEPCFTAKPVVAHTAQFRNKSVAIGASRVQVSLEVAGDSHFLREGGGLNRIANDFGKL